MKQNRRSFLAALAAVPVVAKVQPKLYTHAPMESPIEKAVLPLQITKVDYVTKTITVESRGIYAIRGELCGISLREAKP